MIKDVRNVKHIFPNTSKINENSSSETGRGKGCPQVVEVNAEQIPKTSLAG